MSDIPNGTHVQVSERWEAPYNSVGPEPYSTIYAGQSGIVQVKNTMDEYLVDFDDASLGSWWIEEKYVKDVSEQNMRKERNNGNVSQVWQ